MNKFLINGKQTTPAEWKRVERAFAAVGASPVEYMRDGILVVEEVTAMLDLDSDGHCTFADLAMFQSMSNGAKRFGDVASILRTYGLSWSQVIDDWMSPARSIESNFSFLPGFIQDDKEFVTAVVQWDGAVIRDMLPRFREDKDVVLEAAQRYPPSLESAAPHLLNERAFVLDVVRRNGRTLAYVSPVFKDDDEIVLNAVRQDGCALCFASERLKDNDEIVRAAIRSDGSGLHSASPRLQADRKIVMEAVQNNGLSLSDASPELHADRMIALTAVSQDGQALSAVVPALRRDRELVLVAVRQNGFALKWAAPELQNDAEIVLAAVQQRGEVLEFASPRMQADRNTVLIALQNNWGALQYVAPPLRNDPDLLAAALLINIRVRRFIDKEMLSKAWPIVIDRLAAEGLHIPLGAQKGIDEFFTALRTMNITVHPDRFQSLRALITVWNNRTIQPPSDKPIALLLYAVADGKEAFTMGTPIPDIFIADGRWHVQYFEVDREEKAWAIMRDVSQRGRTPIHTMVLAGHGRFDRLELGSYDFDTEFNRRTGRFARQERRFLDIGDLAQGDFTPLRKYLAKNGQVLLFGCSLGAGGKYRLNMANALAKHAPSGVHFFSSGQDVAFFNLKIGSDMNLQPGWTTEYHFRTAADLKK